MPSSLKSVAFGVYLFSALHYTISSVRAPVSSALNVTNKSRQSGLQTIYISTKFWIATAEKQSSYSRRDTPQAVKSKILTAGDHISKKGKQKAPNIHLENIHFEVVADAEEYGGEYFSFLMVQRFPLIFPERVSIINNRMTELSWLAYEQFPHQEPKAQH